MTVHGEILPYHVIGVDGSNAQYFGRLDVERSSKRGTVDLIVETVVGQSGFLSQTSPFQELAYRGRRTAAPPTKTGAAVS